MSEEITGANCPNCVSPTFGTDYVAWDKAVEAAGINMNLYGWMNLAREKFGPRPMGPSKKASSYCESGKRDYCTCDTCF